MVLGVEELLLAAVRVQSLLICQHGKLNLAQVRSELGPLLELKGQPEAMTKLDALLAVVNRRLSA
jgi:hypothetical protein